MRKLPALLISAGLLAVSLTACSSSGFAACDSPVKTGGSSALVTASGKDGATPSIDFPNPLSSAATERTVMRQGEGARAVEGQQVSVDWSVFNGTTGELVLQSSYDGSDESTFALAPGQLLPGLQQGLLCATAGSRVSLVVPPVDAFGEQGNSQLGIAPTDSMVFVVDVNKVYLAKANGTPQAAVNGMPAVVLDANGVPGITIPSGEAPSDFELAVLKQGKGETVQEGDQVAVHYTGVLWNTKELFDSTWKNGAPANFVAAESSATVQNGVIKGFADALIGQQVGSQIIAVIPPELGYGEQGNSAVPPNATLVFVIDILGIND